MTTGADKQARPKATTSKPAFGYPLNEEQQRAVTHGDGPLLIVAGAGTGKTTVITERVAWLLREGKAQPEELLVLTFTEKAAAEMEERIDRLLPYGYLDITVATFHAFCERTLREYGIDIGINTAFKVFSTADQWLLLRQHLASLKLDYYRPLGNPTKFLHALLTHFSRAKDEDVTPEAYTGYAKKCVAAAKRASAEEQEVARRTMEVAKAYAQYEALLRESGHLDFGDLITQTIRLFRERPSILQELRNRFRFVLVDEFQDTNYAQYELLKLLVQPANNLTVVGDDDQSIYKFRGAAVSNILAFKKDFPTSAEVVLTKNYRSCQNILDLAYRFIQQNNPNRLEARLTAKQVGKKGSILSVPISKKLSSSRSDEGQIQVLAATTADDEALRIVEDILEKKEQHPDCSWNDIAILVRANSQAEAFVAALGRANIPYQFVAAKGLYSKPEVLDLVSYLKMLDNYHESPAFYRVLSMPLFSVQQRTVADVLSYAHRKGISLYEAAERSEEIPSLADDERKKVRRILGYIQKHAALTTTSSVGQVLYAFLTETKYVDSFDRDRDQEKILNIAKFYNTVGQFEDNAAEKSLKTYLEELSLVQEVGEDPAPALVLEGPDAVKVMTVHGAKGLEFSYVYIVQCVDKRFPTVERKDTIPLPDDLVRDIVLEGNEHLEEERRLFYVAMTRAKMGLMLTYARDYGGVRAKKPSRFLFELGLVENTPSRAGQETLPFSTIPKQAPPNPPAGYALPAQFSFTQLKAFETCPKQYWYGHVLHIPIVGKATYSFGKTVHATLKQFYDGLLQKRTPTLKELLRLYALNWVDDWYENKEQEQERKQKGAKALKKFFTAEKKNFRQLPVALEQGFKVHIGTHTLKGAIDRIDPLGTKKEKRVEIIDYKTGNVPKNRGGKSDLDQLVIYAIAAKDVLKLEPEKLTYYYLESGEKISRSVTPEDMRRAQELALATIEKVRASSFAATPDKIKCSYCDFQEICEDRAV